MGFANKAPSLLDPLDQAGPGKLRQRLVDRHSRYAIVARQIDLKGYPVPNWPLT